MSFMSLGLSKPLLDELAAKDYSLATPIQRQATPTVLSGRDLLGIAPLAETISEISALAGVLIEEALRWVTPVTCA